jgi:hypothetical protein
MIITLPFPASILAGHVRSKAEWHKVRATKEHRTLAFDETDKVFGKNPVFPDGDILITITFYPPHNRGDRINYPNRMKPYFDGIADALKVNDKRFLPHYIFMDPDKPGRVEVEIVL